MGPFGDRSLKRDCTRGLTGFDVGDQEAAECDRSCSDSLNGATKETPKTTLSFSLPDQF